MKNFFAPLNVRIGTVVLSGIVLLGSVLILLSQYYCERTALQTLQGVNRSVAMYVAGQEPLITEDGVQEEAVSVLAERAMIINPSLEIYILDTLGNVVSHRMQTDGQIQQHVDLTPLNAFLSGEAVFPILGQDPMRPDQPAIFSTEKIVYAGRHYGYVYAVIGAGMYRELQTEAGTQSSQTLFLGLAIFSALIVGLVALTLVVWVTSPLRKLRNEMLQFKTEDATIVEYTPAQGSCEVAVLQNSFYTMRNTIAKQVMAIEQSDKTRRELIANVSHDLRTPLAAMQGALEILLLRQDSLTKDTIKHHIQGAFNQSKRLTTLVTDLFELAKLESGALKPKFEKFFVMELLQDCSHDLAPLALKKDVKLVLDVNQAENPQVAADIGLIQRVLENLIHNAIQHTPAGGTVTLSVASNSHGVRVAVADTGFGIDRADIPHIFDRFYRAKNTEHSSNIGSGLGLAIVKRILAAHHAKIDVTSQLSIGTKFEFELSAS